MSAYSQVWAFRPEPTEAWQFVADDSGSAMAMVGKVIQLPAVCGECASDEFKVGRLRASCTGCGITYNFHLVHESEVEF